MELVLQAQRATRLRLTLLPEAIRVEESLGPVQQKEEVPYGRLVQRPARHRRTVVIWLTVSSILIALPLGIAWIEDKYSDPAFHIGTLLFGIPALIGLAELLRSFREELCFVRRGDDYTAIRFTKRELQDERVGHFVQELTKRIADAKVP